MDRKSRPVRGAWVAGFVSLVLLMAVSSARAAFPGRNGLLVGQPEIGKGLILVDPDGANARQICPLGPGCNAARDPVWSPDGSEIVFSSPPATDSSVGGPQPYVIYPDGSCLACPVPTTSGNFYLDSRDRNFGPGFLPDGRLAVSIDVNYPPVPQVGAVNTDGAAFKRFHLPAVVWRQPAWASTGRLAAIRRVKRRFEVFVIDPRTGSARQLTREGASSPNWSPDGRSLAVVHRGWIELIGAGGGRLRRLTRGGAPAWAPDGKELAFVGAHDRLFVIGVHGGQPRPVGDIHAQSVDWQPVFRTHPRACQAPAGSSVAAASPDATITIDPAPIGQSPPASGPAFSVLGCRRSDGRQRLLESMPASNFDSALAVGTVAVAGDYAALVNETADIHYGGDGETVAVFDLRTGTTVPNHGGESASCPDYGGYGCQSSVDQLVLGADGVTAAHTGVINSNYPASSYTGVEQIVANDSTGTHILDSIATTGPFTPTPSALSDLTLTGDTLAWSHDGIPESAQLN